MELEKVDKKVLMELFQSEFLIAEEARLHISDKFFSVYLGTEHKHIITISGYQYNSFVKFNTIQIPILQEEYQVIYEMIKPKVETILKEKRIREHNNDCEDLAFYIAEKNKREIRKPLIEKSNG